MVRRFYGFLTVGGREGGTGARKISKRCLTTVFKIREVIALISFLAVNIIGVVDLDLLDGTAKI